MASQSMRAARWRARKIPLKVMELPYYVALGTLITQEFIDKEKARLGNLFAQEYECAFISSGNAAIEPELLERGGPEWIAYERPRRPKGRTGG